MMVRPSGIHGPDRLLVGRRVPQRRWRLSHQARGPRRAQRACRRAARATRPRTDWAWVAPRCGGRWRSTAWRL